MKPHELASIILRGPLEVAEVEARLVWVLELKKTRQKIAKRVVKSFGEGSRPSVRVVVDWLESDRKIVKLWEKGKIFGSSNVDLVPAKMAPDRYISENWNVPSITTLGDLARFLAIPLEHLDWFCSQYDSAELGSKLSHYHVVKIPKKAGGWRLLEVPKWEMKKAQRIVLDQILNHIPSHKCSHGFQPGRSIITYVEPHVGQQVIVKFDLRDYFITADRPRARSLFHLAGYPPHISQYLASLCTHGFRDDTLKLDWRYERPHLPQGAPSSPAIADRLLHQLDVRLSGLAMKLEMSYTRYADDLAFSSEKRLRNQQIEGLKSLVNTIVTEEGWGLNTKKTNVMHTSQRQRLAGLVVNSKTNVARSEYDLLKAIIHRVSLNGLEAENRDDHPSFLSYLEGRVSFVQMGNPKRGEKLGKMLDKIRV